MTTRRAIASVAVLFVTTAILAPALLRAADDKAAAKANLLKPTNAAETWRLEQHEGGKATMTVDGDAVAFDVADTGPEEWHVQAVQTGLDLADGKEYVLSFKAKASGDRTMTLNAMVDEDDWHTIGLEESADLTTEWKEFSYPFTVAQAAKEKKNRISFILGNEKGKVSFKDVALTAK